MGKRTNRTGRNKSAGRFVSLPYAHMETIAWQSLNCVERDLYIFIKSRFNGSNNGNIGASLREACEYLKCGKPKALKAFNNLQKVGFIEAAIKGSFDWKSTPQGKSRSTRWLLTCEPQDLPVKFITAKNTFKTWKPSNAELIEAQAKKDVRKKQTSSATNAKKKKMRVRSTNPLGNRNKPIKAGMGNHNEPIGYVQRTDKSQNQNSMGTFNEPVYISTISTHSAAQASGQSKGQAQPCASDALTEEASNQAKVIHALGGFCKARKLSKPIFDNLVEQQATHNLDDGQIRSLTIRALMANSGNPLAVNHLEEIKGVANA